MLLVKRSSEKIQTGLSNSNLIARQFHSFRISNVKTSTLNSLK